jgi:hypothetical protein
MSILEQRRARGLAELVGCMGIDALVAATTNLPKTFYMQQILWLLHCLAFSRTYAWLAQFTTTAGDAASWNGITWLILGTHGNQGCSVRSLTRARWTVPPDVGLF